MKTTPQKKQSKTAVLYPPPFRVETKNELIRIPYTTGKKRAVSVNNIADGLEHLAELAALSSEENPESFKARFDLFEIVAATIGRMNQQARQKPKLWHEVAERAGVWPVNYNKTPFARRYADELLDSLHVGKKVIPRMHPKSRMDFIANPSQDVAIQLLATIIRARKTSFYQMQKNIKPAGWRRDALKLELAEATDAEHVKKRNRSQWRKVAEAVLSEAGYDAAQFGTEPDEKGEARFRKDSYRRMKFWQTFNQLLLDAEKQLATLTP